MKKFVVLSLISFLVLAFGVTVYGQEKAPVLEFKASGFIDVISEYTRNVMQPGSGTSALANAAITTGGATGVDNVMFGAPPAYLLPTANGANDRAFDKRNAYMENRGRLKFDAIMGKEMMGTFQFEFDSTRWGERIPGANTIGGQATSQRGFAGYWGVADRDAFELKHMYLTFGMPWIPIPTTIMAGIQPLAIRPGAFLLTDGPGITAAFKVDPAMIKIGWFKALENFDWAADDDDLYLIEANAKIQTITVGGYVVNFNLNSYPFSTEGAPSFSSNVSWYGFYVDGKVGPVNLNFDFVYDKGKNVDRRDQAQARDVKYQGYGLIGNVSYPWEKFLFGFASIYGSGADQKKTSASGDPGSTVANTSGGAVTSNKAGAFIVPGGTEGANGQSLVLCGAGINRINTGIFPGASSRHARAPYGGLWINKIYGGFQVSPQFSTRIEGMYIRDNTKNGNTIGNALTSTGFPRDDKSIGWEIDWFNTLSIYKNLTFQFGGGILFAGKAMDYAVIGAANGTNKEPKDPFVVTTNLTYSF